MTVIFVLRWQLIYYYQAFKGVSCSMTVNCGECMDVRTRDVVAIFAPWAITFALKIIFADGPWHWRHIDFAYVRCVWLSHGGSVPRKANCSGSGELPSREPWER